MSTEPTHDYLVDDFDEPTTVWVAGHLETIDARREALEAVITDWEGLTDWIDLCETDREAIVAADASMVWMCPDTTLNEEERRAAEEWYGDGWAQWADCEETDEGAQPFTALQIA